MDHEVRAKFEIDAASEVVREAQTDPVECVHWSPFIISTTSVAAVGAS